MIYKAAALRINLHFIKLIHSFLTCRKLTICYKGKQSTPFIPTVGTPQGSPLSPLLYITYTADIPTPPPSITLQMFADDTAVWTTITKNTVNVNHLQSFVNRVAKWFDDWKIKINPTKSHAVLFSAAASKIHFQHIRPININDVPIPMSKETTYLGFHFQNNCSVAREISRLRSLIRSRSAYLHSIIPKTSNTDKSLLHAYKTLVRPILDYRATALSYATKSQFSGIARTERRILRRITKLPFDYPSSQVHQYCHIPTLEKRVPDLISRFATNIIRRKTPAGLQLLTKHHHRLSTRTILPAHPKRKLAWPPSIFLSLVTDTDFQILQDEHNQEDANEEINALIQKVIDARIRLARIPDYLKTFHFIGEDPPEGGREHEDDNEDNGNRR